MVKINIKNEGSKKFEMNKEDLKKICKGALIALAGAAIVFISDYGLNIDFGQWNVIVAAFGSVIINFLRKYIQDNK